MFLQYNVRLYEIEPILETPIISMNLNYKVTITYSSAYEQKLYRINEGEWQTYPSSGIQLLEGQTISAQGITKLGLKSDISVKKAEIGPLIPKLTSNIGPNGKVTCSSIYGGSWDGWIAFCERTAGDGWYAIESPAWIQYEFNNPTIVKRIYLYAVAGSSGSNTTDILLQYSNDGVTYYNVMDSYTYTINNETYIDINQTATARYWKLNFTQAERVYNLQFYGI